ncbi:MAG TPA: NADPH:quinone oxidoreductase family protein [Dongiaceae bacterium]|jgi:NADPH2:quinone reductase
MRAVQCVAWGGLEKLELHDIPPPGAPAAGEILIDVAAAGLNYADLLVTAGKYQERPLPPFIPGFEIAGTVRAVGAGVGRIKAGDRVLAAVDRGGFAEQAIARESDTFVIPDAMDFTAAAGFAIAYGTSYGALTWRADIKPGELLLVLGAAGGVGLTAVEIGKALGARVIACAGGAEKLAIAKAHGADFTIDYREENLRGRIREISDGVGVDVVYDPVGGESFNIAMRSTNWNGRLIVVGFAGGTVPQIPANILLVKNLAALGFYWSSYRFKQPALLAPAFARMFEWWQQGKLKPRISGRYDLAEVKTALSVVAERKAIGKIVLTTG